ncbi:hypothetical protein HPB50_027722 [Hyalomma asiaticum]|nr:hypothetical protein HPB50_027722 [Hyalomma asiaticum]
MMLDDVRDLNERPLLCTVEQLTDAMRSGNRGEPRTIFRHDMDGNYKEDRPVEATPEDDEDDKSEESDCHESVDSAPHSGTHAQTVPSFMSPDIESYGRRIKEDIAKCYGAHLASPALSADSPASPASVVSTGSNVASSPPADVPPASSPSALATAFGGLFVRPRPSPISKPNPRGMYRLSTVMEVSETSGKGSTGTMIASKLLLAPGRPGAAPCYSVRDREPPPDLEKRRNGPASGTPARPWGRRSFLGLVLDGATGLLPAPSWHGVRDMETSVTALVGREVLDTAQPARGDTVVLLVRIRCPAAPSDAVVGAGTDIGTLTEPSKVCSRCEKASGHPSDAHSEESSHNSDFAPVTTYICVSGGRRPETNNRCEDQESQECSIDVKQRSALDVLSNAAVRETPCVRFYIPDGKDSTAGVIYDLDTCQ